MKYNDRLRLRALVDTRTATTEIPLETARLALAVLESLEECERRLDRLRAKWIARGKTIARLQRDNGIARVKAREEKDAKFAIENRGVADASPYKKLAEYLDAKLEKAEERMLETAAWLDEFAKVPETDNPECPVCKARRDLAGALTKRPECGDL